MRGMYLGCALQLTLIYAQENEALQKDSADVTLERGCILGNKTMEKT